MKPTVNILITERNSHVREFLKRELMGEGFFIHEADSGKEMLRKIYFKDPLDVLVLDPDLADTDIPEILGKINDRIPKLAVVFHTFPADYSQYAGTIDNAVFVEKQGNSVEKIKQVIHDLMREKHSKNQTVGTTNP
jgi:DNA-binding NtrC family response regulator